LISFSLTINYFRQKFRGAKLLPETQFSLPQGLSQGIDQAFASSIKKPFYLYRNPPKPAIAT